MKTRVRWLKAGAWTLGLYPFARLGWRILLGDGLGANPIEAVNDWAGFWGLSLLTATLAVTPVRRLTGWNELVRIRRTLGLFAFTLIAIHFTNYVAVDQFFAWDFILEDITERPYIVAGFTGLVILTALAVTSTRGWIRRLGRGWGRLHSLVYLAGGLGVVHYLWQGKQADTRAPVLFGATLVLLLALRLPPGVRLSARVRGWLREARSAATPRSAAVRQPRARPAASAPARGSPPSRATDAPASPARAGSRGVCVSLAVAAALAAGGVAACSAGGSPAPDDDDPDPRWSEAAPLPQPIQELHAAVLGGRIYVAGGLDGSGGATDAAFRYDPAADLWEPIASLPAPRHHMPLAVVAGSLYAVGGLGPEGFIGVSTLWRYDEAGDRWLERAPLPRPRGASAVVAVDGKLIAVGGFDEGRRLVAETHIYDPAADAWSEAAPIPTPRDHLGAAEVDGIVYAVGGRPLDPDRNFAVVEAFDPEAGAWTPQAPMPTPRGGLAVAVVAGRLHVLGGETSRSVFGEHEVYDPAADGWAPLPDLPTPRHGLGAAAVEGRIFTIGGGPRAGLAQTAVVEVFTP